MVYLGEAISPLLQNFTQKIFDIPENNNEGAEDVLARGR